MKYLIRTLPPFNTPLYIGIKSSLSGPGEFTITLASDSVPNFQQAVLFRDECWRGLVLEL